MNPEAFLFSVMVALIGMCTVFIGLTLLSLMMMLLRRVFRGEEARFAAPPTLPLKISIEPVERDTRWLVAAVGAFLAEEAQDSARSAVHWRPAAGDRLDPWVSQPRI